MRGLHIVALWLAFLTGCETDLLNDPSFDRWCGEQLCDWSTDVGSIERVGSWHEKDYAVSFVDVPTRISQPSSMPVPTGCIDFEMIADTDAHAELMFMVDFQDDGVFDQMFPVPAAHWATTSFVFHVPSSVTHLRYAFQKNAPGRAVLAQIWATSTSCQDDSSESDASLPR